MYSTLNRTTQHESKGHIVIDNVSQTCCQDGRLLVAQRGKGAVGSHSFGFQPDREVQLYKTS